MNKLLLSLLAVAALGAVTVQLSAKNYDNGYETGTHTVKCGHCKKEIAHKDAPCSTHGCPGATVLCEKEVVVKEEKRRACDETYTYECPAGSEQQGEGENIKCVVRKVTEKHVTPIKNCEVNCSNACPAGTTMVPGSEQDGHSHSMKRKMKNKNQ